MKYYYQPSFSPYQNSISAKNKKEALKKLFDLWKEYPKNSIRKWSLT